MSICDKNLENKLHLIIDKVRFGLHPTFGVDYREIKSSIGQKFEICYNGWGVFEVPISIYWNKKIGLN